jgi:hypothetical protein
MNANNPATTPSNAPTTGPISIIITRGFIPAGMPCSICGLFFYIRSEERDVNRSDPKAIEHTVSLTINGSTAYSYNYGANDTTGTIVNCCTLPSGPGVPVDTPKEECYLICNGQRKE